MAWILKALESIQNEIRQNEPSSSEPSSGRFDRSYPIEQINDHLYEVSKPLGRPSVELVFFHGLQLETSKETYLTTWVSGGGSELWLDWLLTPFPRARILFVSYDASTRKTDREGRMDKYATCENLVNSLIKGGAGIGQDGCPVVLVGHCLGGLIMKELCLLATKTVSLNRPDEQDVQALENLLRNIRGLFFYSTPHHGSRLADSSTEIPKGPLFEVLTTLNTETERCNEEFRKLRNKYGWKAVGVGESSVVTSGQFKGFVVVEEASARHDVDSFYTIAAADHFRVCRPDSMTSGSFDKLRIFVTDLLKEYKNREGPKVDLHDKVVGLELQVARSRDLLQTTKRLGIVGMGGIGKTTLAQHLYNVISGDFEYSCFLPEVKLYMSRRENLHDFQRKIVSRLCCGRQKVHENFQWSSLEGKRVLIVLDDVETNSQVQVMTEPDGFHGDSRVIVTSRYSRFLIGEKFKCQPLEQLNEEDSRRLFCLHAFDCAEPPSGYEERVVSMLKKCDGLPLALEVAGKYLYKQPSQSTWDEAVETLSRAEPLDGREEDGLWSILNASYTSLAASEREMFLDIATCFHDEPLEIVKGIWRAKWDCVENKWQNLLDKNLVKIVKRKDSGTTLTWDFDIVEIIKMHEVLRDLGRCITCPKSLSVLCHSRVFSTSGVPSGLFDQARPAVKVLKIIGNMTGVPISIRSLRGLEELEVLWLERVKLKGPSYLLPKTLVSLTILRCEWFSDSFADANANFQQFMRHSDVRHVYVEDYESFHCIFDCDGVPVVFNGVEEFPCLTDRTFDAESVRNSPNTLDQSPLLKSMLEGDHCSRFEQNLPILIQSSRELYKLVVARALPLKLWYLEGLTHLTLHRCDLNALPDAIGKFQALKHLEIKRCGIIAIPESIGMLRALRSLTITDCHDLMVLPDALFELGDLAHLNIENCYKLKRGQPGFRFEGNITKVSWGLILLHRKAMEKVSGSEYEGALADLNSCSLEGLEPQYKGFLLQERGIVKSRAGDLQGACRDLSAALGIFSGARDLHAYQHNCCKHRGFVNFLLEDLDGARKDGAMALKVCSIEFPESVISPSLGDEGVAFMHCRLKGSKAFAEDEIEWKTAHHQMLCMVTASQSREALALWDAFDARVSGYYSRAFFFQERGILKRLVNDLDGALHDLTSALDFDNDDYDCFKHRGYVKFLLGDIAGARIDAEKCLALGFKQPSDNCLGTGPVAFLEFYL